LLSKTLFLKDLELIQLEKEDNKQNVKPLEIKLPERKIQVPELPVIPEAQHKEKDINGKDSQMSVTTQSIISVSVAKLDKLMDLVGEMVIAEAMVIQNPDLQGLILNNFQKASRQLSKITSEIQDVVMSIRMVPLSATFHKMHRIVRDMNKKLGKDVKLEIIGEDTEVDKNIIEHISDPLMHLVRNALDHGIESAQEREQKGKPGSGTITLEAKNAGSDVLVIVKDDGKGLDKARILKKARENNLLYKNEEDMADREIYNMILLPGFSTKEKVTEFSGRGVGMDVVTKNIETVGGALLVDSVIDKGTLITLKIPLTLAIIDGMTIKVGNSYYTIPTVAIKESFRPKEQDLITDPDGNEMIMVRGQCYPILRLHERFKVKTAITGFTDGIIIMVELEDRRICIFADGLIGQQQVVVKSLPEYIQQLRKIKGLGGCTLLGDGSISLILDVTGLINAKRGTTQET
jgi:two-component system chemotaxis sensor kinase CheA